MIGQLKKSEVKWREVKWSEVKWSGMVRGSLGQWKCSLFWNGCIPV